ncbi:hypothetical protein PMU03_09120, partial [Enterococcus faecalis]|nr:hypothetical protein [Enterococcus faecalis]
LAKGMIYQLGEYYRTKNDSENEGLLLFASFALIMMWCAYVTRKNRQFIDGKLEQNEANLQKTV